MKITTCVDTTDFKKETISKLLYDSGERNNAFTTWTNRFELDSSRFYLFLQSQVFLLKGKIYKLTDSNVERLRLLLHELLVENVENNYILIRRHYTLLNILSEFVFELSSTNYTTIKDLISAFKNKKIRSITKLINEAYKNLVADFDEVQVKRTKFGIANIDKAVVVQLNKKIDDMHEKIYTSHTKIFGKYCSKSITSPGEKITSLKKYAVRM